MALYVKERKDWKELAIIYTDDDYGIDLHKDFVSNIADASIDIINELEED